MIPASLLIKANLEEIVNDITRGSLGFSLSTDKDANRGKVAYIWISPNPAKAKPAPEGVVCCVIVCCLCHRRHLSRITMTKPNLQN